METKIIVQARISFEVRDKLASVKKIPHKEWHKRNVPDYYGSFITKYTNTAEFQMEVKAAEHRAQMAQKDSEVRAAKAEASSAKFRLTREIETLRKQIEELKRPKAA